MAIVNSFGTDRLDAERLATRHFDDFCRMHSDPTVMSTLGGVRSNERTSWYLRENLEHWEHHRYGLWVFRDKATGAFVGRGGLRNIVVGDSAEVELAYAIMGEFWGKGLATEMAKAIVGLAFERYHMKNVVAFTLPNNLASRRVMEKVGLEFERDIVHADQPHVLYRIVAHR